MNDKDFKILLPGSCNAQCSFCFWKHKEISIDWISALDKALSDATSDFKQLNISGGEPTISPYIKETMEIISKYRHKFPKIVLTTNGSNLENVIGYIDGIVDHLNISRHHYNSLINRDIFRSENVPDNYKLTTLIKAINHGGTDVTLNVMVNNEWNGCDLFNFVEFAKNVGASYLVFRHDYNQGLRISNFEKLIDSKIVYKFSCEVCRTNTRIIDGLYVSWKYGVMEPSDTVDDFEIVLGQNGTLSFDYEGTKPFKFN